MNKGKEYVLPSPGEVKLGRSENNDVCVFDKKSSRVHCKIRVEEDKFILEDLGSTNGSKLNDEFITGKKELAPGDRVGIGQTVFVLAEDSVGNNSGKEFETDKKYENLIRKTSFQATKTTALRKMKTEEAGKETGFLSFFDVDNSEKS
jgi:pSer/pThr/pTyr-binding forkhead associated (FHA) protein